MTRLLVFCIAAQQLTGVQSYQMMPQRAAIDPLIYRARTHSLFSNSGRDEESSEPIFVDSAGKEFSQEQLDEIEEAKPSELSIMKDVRFLDGEFFFGLWTTSSFPHTLLQLFPSSFSGSIYSRIFLPVWLSSLLVLISHWDPDGLVGRWGSRVQDR